MSITFLHTADWHVGKPFAGIQDPDKRAIVRQERLAAIRRLGETARERKAAFVLVAGDLFDSPRPTQAEVASFCAAVHSIGLPVLAIPGNHDHAGEGSVWHQGFFQNLAATQAPNLRVVLEAAPIQLEGATIFPCPLARRHEATDTTAWLRDPDVFAAHEGPRVVLAHGSVQGFSGSDEDGNGYEPNLIALERLPADHLDYIALGDWHGAKNVGTKAWYSGTPEPDRFSRGEAHLPGRVLLVTAARGALPQVEEISTARIGWHRHNFDFSEDASLEVLRGQIHNLIGNEAQRDLLELELNGSLGFAALNQLEQFVTELEARLLRIKLTNNVTVAPTDEELDQLANRDDAPLVARVARRLLETVQANGPDAAKARLALRELHALCLP